MCYNNEIKFFKGEIMKKAFTMIELIFVIVILGILAAVALPKFLGVAQQAHEGNIKSFIGTLNRTVAPTLWSKSIAEGHDGNISYLDLEYYKGNSDNNLTKYVDMPKEIKDLNLSHCNNPSEYKIVGWIDSGVAGANYFIACVGGNANQAPKFAAFKQISPTNELSMSNLGDHNTTDIAATPAQFSGSEEGNLLK